MSETRAIEIPVYRDKDGKQACAESMEKQCMFSIWYDGYQCFFDDGESSYNNATPHKKCPLWAKELKNA